MIGIDIQKVLEIQNKYSQEIKEQRLNAINKLLFLKNTILSNNLSIDVNNVSDRSFNISNSLCDFLKEEKDTIKHLYYKIIFLEEKKILSKLNRIKEWKVNKDSMICGIIKVKKSIILIQKFVDSNLLSNPKCQLEKSFTEDEEWDNNKALELWKKITSNQIKDQLNSFNEKSELDELEDLQFGLEDVEEIEDVITFFENEQPLTLIDIQKKRFKRDNWKFKDEIVSCLGYQDLRSTFYPKYFNDLGIKACVYCNSQLTIVAKKNLDGEFSAKFDVDHYLPKDKYPFLSISLFNLFPACASCNLAKKIKEVNFNLYSSNVNGENIVSNFRFSLSPEGRSNYLLHKNKEDIQISFKEPKIPEGLCTFEETFHIEGIYNTQKDLAEELIIKSQMYSDSYIKTLENSFSSLQLNSTLFKRMIVGNYTEEKDIHKRPMSKFTMDIAKQLGLIDKLK